MHEKKSLTFTQVQVSLILFFVLSRLTMALFYDAYVTDVAFYLDIVKQGLLTHAKAYENFPFGYPPLALLFVYLPAFVSNLDFWDYWRAFRSQMFLIELTLFAACFYHLKEYIKLDDSKLATFVGFYTLFGLLQGHLLYDRLDLLIVASLLGLFLLFTKHPQKKNGLRLISTLGMLVKFVPFLYALALNLVGHFRFKGAQKQEPIKLGSLLRWGVQELVLLIVPFILLISLYESTVAKGVFADLTMHARRGIQVESLWATPIAIKHLFAPETNLVVSNFGAQHINEKQVPEWYLHLSKWAGILALALFGLFLFLKRWPQLAVQKWEFVDSSRFAVLLWLAIFGIFLSTQRVLSPQFFIWLMFPISISLAIEFDKKLAGLACATYILTYIGFDLGYWKFVAGNPFFVAVVTLRNITLLILTLYSVKKLLSFQSELKKKEQ